MRFHGHSNRRRRGVRARQDVTNDELARTGRHVARMDCRQDRHPRAAHLGPGRGPQRHGAARRRERCLSHAGVDKSAVDLIIVACATPDQIQPAVACLVQEKLGMAEGQCPAFDVNSVCAGFVFALDVAQSMMLAAPEQFRNALVIGTDAFSKILNWDDRRTCIFFGDGAGAVLLSQTERRRAAHRTSVWAATAAAAATSRCRPAARACRSTRRFWKSALEQVQRWTAPRSGISPWRRFRKTIRSLLADHGLTPATIWICWSCTRATCA